MRLPARATPIYGSWEQKLPLINVRFGRTRTNLTTSSQLWSKKFWHTFESSGVWQIWGPQGGDFKAIGRLSRPAAARVLCQGTRIRRQHAVPAPMSHVNVGRINRVQRPALSRCHRGSSAHMVASQLLKFILSPQRQGENRHQGRPTSRSRPRNRSAMQNTNADKFCWFHCTYGSHSYNCGPLCPFLDSFRGKKLGRFEFRRWW